MISIEHLSKVYGNHKAVDDISFNILEDHIYGFLGPNGAGKSTTMNIITGCLSMTEGKVSIFGHDIFEDAKEAKKLIGYLPEIPPLYVDMTPAEYLGFVARVKGLSKESIPEAIDAVMQRTGISEMADRLIKNLSKGYRQRVGIAQAILGNPKLIILDEPTVGLDPKQIIEIRNLITELGKEHTVILSSHILSEVQQLCDKVIIINEGKLVADVDASEIGGELEEYFLKLTGDSPNKEQSDADPYSQAEAESDVDLDSLALSYPHPDGDSPAEVQPESDSDSQTIISQDNSEEQEAEANESNI